MQPFNDCNVLTCEFFDGHARIAISNLEVDGKDCYCHINVSLDRPGYTEMSASKAVRLFGFDVMGFFRLFQDALRHDGQVKPLFLIQMRLTYCE